MMGGLNLHIANVYVALKIRSLTLNNIESVFHECATIHFELIQLFKILMGKDYNSPSL